MSIKTMIKKAGHTVDVQVKSDTRASGGETKSGWTTVSESVRCWVQPAASEIRDAYSKRDIYVTNTVFFYADPGISIEDLEKYRLVYEGRNYAIHGTNDAAGLGRLFAFDIGGVR